MTTITAKHAAHELRRRTLDHASAGYAQRGPAYRLSGPELQALVAAPEATPRKQADPAKKLAAAGASMVAERGSGAWWRVYRELRARQTAPAQGVVRMGEHVPEDASPADLDRLWDLVKSA